LRTPARATYTLQMNPRFYFATCQIGAEKAVKTEVLAEHPDLRFAFSRPGFITFKEVSDEGPALELKRSVFTRLWGEVLSQTRDRATLPELFALIPQGTPVQGFDRDEAIPGDEPDGFVRNAHIKGILAEYAASSGSAETGNSITLSDVRAVPGKPVLSLVWVDDFHVFLVRHLPAARQLGTAGNLFDTPLPAHAPSRAWLKLEEAIARFGPPSEKGWKALEIGSAPGGATTALLDRGFTVTGIDPQFMDERVLARSEFTHIRKPARFVEAAELKDCNPDWLVMDMSIAPSDAIGELVHVTGLLRSLFGKELKIRKAFLTIKLNDWKYAAEIPQYLKRLEQAGFRDMKAIQLASNRQEFLVYAAGFRS
jgi:23S rRNA (cytidine2498-2'-O)-methyltransferase